MAVFSTNQVRHLYVANKVEDALATKGGVSVLSDAEGNVFIKHLGAGGVTRTDIIDPKLVTYAKHTTAAKLQEKPKKVTVTIVDLPGVSFDCMLSVVLSQYVGMSDDDRTVKYALAKADVADTSISLAKRLAISLAKNLSKEPQKSLKVLYGTTEVTALTKETALTEDVATITIEAVEQPWTRGLNAGRLAQFTVIANPVTIEGVESSAWATVTEGVSDTVIKDGHKIADLEYFCMGDRADVYRGMAWPHVVPTEYLVDPEKEYDVIDIHYSYKGTCEDSQLSEKDLTLVAEGAVATALVTKLKAVGIEVK